MAVNWPVYRLRVGSMLFGIGIGLACGTMWGSATPFVLKTIAAVCMISGGIIVHMTRKALPEIKPKVGGALPAEFPTGSGS